MENEISPVPAHGTPIEVELPNGRVLKFPPTMPMEEIEEHARRQMTSSTPVTGFKDGLRPDTGTHMLENLPAALAGGSIGMNLTGLMGKLFSKAPSLPTAAGPVAAPKLPNFSPRATPNVTKGNMADDVMEQVTKGGLNPKQAASKPSTSFAGSKPGPSGGKVQRRSPQHRESASTLQENVQKGVQNDFRGPVHIVKEKSEFPLGVTRKTPPGKFKEALDERAELLGDNAEIERIRAFLAEVLNRDPKKASLR